MCGRYSIGEGIQQLSLELDVAPPPDFVPRYNAAPSQALPVVSNAQRQQVALYTWGVIPFWAKEKGQRLINARAETVAEKSTFKKSFQQRRCLVLADGYYEWKKTPQGKVPHRLMRTDEQPFVFAGLWDERADQETGEVHRDFCIITTAASPSIADIHDRTPVILPKEVWDFWLGDTDDYTGLADVLRPLEDDKIKAYEVSKQVNNVQNDEADLTRLNSK
jgi:putative SOS response-associated peptidase YedK